MNPNEPAAPPSREAAMLFVQSIKGAPASVLLALAFAGRSMSHGELLLWTRCGKDQITFALRSLVESRWVEALGPRGPWRLRRELLNGALNPCQESIPLKGLSSTSDSLNLSTEEPVLPSPFQQELLSTMYSAGIREPTASELAALPHMNVEYLQAHVAGARAHGLRIGAAIEAMRLGAPPPHGGVKRDRQAEVEAKFRRFIEGS